MNENIYFDNAATTIVAPNIIQAIANVLEKNYGNPSSLHILGVNAENEIINTKKIIMRALNIEDGDVIFTSGGTESNTMAIQGIAKRYKRYGNKVITVHNEHPSVLENFKVLESQGYEVTYLDTDENGVIDLNELQSSITDETTLVSIMYVNNETGVIQNIKDISKCIKEKNNKTKLHVDAVQAFGKINIDMKHIDAMTISAHKIHGMKGVGALYKRKDLLIEPIFYGGGQQNGLRVGTENVAGIASLGVATKEMYENMSNNFKYVSNLKEKMLDSIKEIDNIKVNGQYSSPYILNISFLGVRGEVLLHALEQNNIYVSTGAACSSKTNSKLENIRFSFSKYNTIEEVELCGQYLRELVPRLRKVMK